MAPNDFRVLTFDVYGTLIDWESGLLAQLRPWARQHGIENDDDTLLAAFGELEHQWQHEHPTMRYADLLFCVHEDLARRLGAAPDVKAARAFSRSVPDWPAFDDTAHALAALKQRFTLCVLSNVDNDSLRSTLPRLGVEFERRFTAEDIGSYKPDRRNFRHAQREVEAMGFEPRQWLHVGQSLFHDHEPAAELGIANCWIDRRAGRDGEGAVKPARAMPKLDFRFASLAEFAAAV